MSIVPAMNVCPPSPDRGEFLRRGLEHVEIEVDGGVSPESIRALADASMTIAAAATSVFDPRAPVASNVGVLRAACGFRESARYSVLSP